MSENKYIVAVGDPFDVINFVGPFDSFDDAELWSDKCGQSNWIVSLYAPDDWS